MWPGFSRKAPRDAGVAEVLPDETIAGASVDHVIAPSVFKAMVPRVTDRIGATSPDVVIMMGEFRGSA